ncbi:MAG: PTS sugar transporter subunit IIA [Parachlamydiales bacterium]
MTDLDKVIDPNTILFLKVEERDEAIKELVECLHRSHKLKVPDPFLAAVLARETLVSTGIGMGVAFPHAKLPELKQFFVAIGIQKERGIEWHSPDRTPVRLIFLIGGPDNQQNAYLTLLSRLTVVLKEEECRKKLLKAESAEEVAELIISYTPD